ncbi:hypothetical protein [Yinghuangia sp. YIM S09857]|uniref:hypothetical protein n=1 Tax=Yinghuangia sp. YIM S09857 TaxID=3436929 RepID=UPI003F52EC8D
MFPTQDPYGPQQYAPAPGQGTHSPWIVTIATAVVALALVGGLLASSGDGSESGMPVAAPGDMPSARVPSGRPTDHPTMPSFTARPSGPKTPGSRTPTAAPKTTKAGDWDTAEGDTDPFTTAEWFPAVGDFSIQKRPYVQLAQDERNCTAAEPAMRSLFSDDCIGVIRSLWTTANKKYVGQLSVISLTDKAAAKSIQNRLSAGQSNGAFVQFVTPPSGSGVRFSERYPTWVGTTTAGHYMIVTEVALTNGGAIDATAKQMYDDLYLVAGEHINAQIWE